MPASRMAMQCGLALACLSLGLAPAVAADKEADRKDAVFEMREVSVFDKNDIQPNPWCLTVGAYAECSTVPDKAVKAYPKLKSSRPLYGKLVFDRDFFTGKSIEFRFVLDESGESPAGEKKKEEKPTEKKKAEPSLLQSLWEKMTGAADSDESAKKPPEPEAKLSPYDRLYFDTNRDLDLTNDGVLKSLKDPPWQALPAWNPKERAAFEHLNIDVDYGPGVGVRPFRVLPWLTISEDGKQTYRTMHFVATVARQGRIRIGKREYDALLAQAHNVSGRFDRVWTALYLKPIGSEDKTIESAGFAGKLLATLHRADGQFYTTAATPLGDKLTVKPFRGDLGVFAIGPGGRDIKDLAFQGSLQSTNMAIGLEPEKAASDGKQAKMREYKAPVGDYVPSYLSIKYGRLRIDLSDNYHSEGRARSLGTPRNFFIKIRKDKPFVLDFANKPAVLFTSPAKDQIFKPGDEINVKAVLVDPVLNIMIRRLTDTSRKEEKTTKLADGQEMTVKEERSLEPVVTITDSSGKQVAQGVMPFG